MTRPTFQREEGTVLPAQPQEADLQQLLGLRLMGACWSPFVDDPRDPDVPARVTVKDMLASRDPRMLPRICTLWWVHIVPSFHVGSMLGVVTVQQGPQTAFHRVGMVVAGHPAASARTDLVGWSAPAFAMPPALPSAPEGSRLDGCSYRATFSNHASTLKVAMAPVTPLWRTWESTFVAVAEHPAHHRESCAGRLPGRVAGRRAVAGPPVTTTRPEP